MQYLADILNKEADVYHNYLALAAKKKQALIENDFETLESVTVQEKVLSAQILKLESERYDFLEEQGLGRNITVNEIMAAVPAADQEMVRNSAQRLREVLLESRKFNETNMALLRQSSNYINHMIKIFAKNIEGEQPTYGRGVQGFKPTKLADVEG